MSMETYHIRYLSLIRQWNDKSIVLDKSKVFEYMCAIKYNLILWEDIPCEVKDILTSKYQISDFDNYGIDLDLTRSACIKLSTVLTTDITNYCMYSSFMLGLKNPNLFTTTDTKITKNVNTLCSHPKINILIVRESFDDLLKESLNRSINQSL